MLDENLPAARALHAEPTEPLGTNAASHHVNTTSPRPRALPERPRFARAFGARTNLAATSASTFAPRCENTHRTVRSRAAKLARSAARYGAQLERRPRPPSMCAPPTSGDPTAVFRRVCRLMPGPPTAYDSSARFTLDLGLAPRYEWRCASRSLAVFRGRQGHPPHVSQPTFATAARISPTVGELVQTEQLPSAQNIPAPASPSTFVRLRRRRNETDRTFAATSTLTAGPAPHNMHPVVNQPPPDTPAPMTFKRLRSKLTAIEARARVSNADNYLVKTTRPDGTLADVHDVRTAAIDQPGPSAATAVVLHTSDRSLPLHERIDAAMPSTRTTIEASKLEQLGDLMRRLIQAAEQTESLPSRTTKPVCGEARDFLRQLEAINAPLDPNIVSTIGRLDRCLSELVLLAREDVDEPDRQTLKHHCDDMIGAANKVRKLLGLTL